MPMYEYLCNDCGYDFERVQSFHDEPLSTCPECGGTVRRVISAVGIIFKGSGWYITDSKRQITAGKAGAKTTSGDDATDTAADGAAKDGEVAAGGADKSGGEGAKAGAADKADKADSTGKAEGAGKADQSAGKTAKPATETKTP